MNNKIWWECWCGKKVVTLTDQTKCKCKDVYEDAWFLMPENKEALTKEREERETER